MRGVTLGGVTQGSARAGSHGPGRCQRPRRVLPTRTELKESGQASLGGRLPPPWAPLARPPCHVRPSTTPRTVQLTCPCPTSRASRTAPLEVALVGAPGPVAAVVRAAAVRHGFTFVDTTGLLTVDSPWRTACTPTVSATRR